MLSNIPADTTDNLQCNPVQPGRKRCNSTGPEAPSDCPQYGLALAFGPDWLHKRSQWLTILGPSLALGYVFQCLTQLKVTASPGSRALLKYWSPSESTYQQRNWTPEIRYLGTLVCRPSRSPPLQYHASVIHSLLNVTLSDKSSTSNPLSRHPFCNWLMCRESRVRSLAR
jgi:hypothetical protein